MTPLVDYWLKANLFLVLFYSFYALLLRRHTFLTLNRTYLMGSLVLAFVLPLVHIPGLSFPWPWEETDVPAYASVTVDAISVVGLPTQADAPLLPDWPVLAVWAFTLVAAGLLIRTVWRTASLIKLIRQWPAQPLGTHTLVWPNNAQTPTFSFFRYLVLNPDDAQTEAVRQHELVHIRQKHSVDVLVLELLQALCWPNPALFGYRQAIRQVHEYLADRDATPQTTTDRDAYARFLVSYAFHLPAGSVMTDSPYYESLAHSFGPDRPDSPTLKQRIQMLYQQQTRRRALWKYAMVLPLATALLAMTTEPEVETLTDQLVTDSLTTVHVRGTVIDQSGIPIPGAKIAVRNGYRGTTTDVNGQFAMNVPAKTVLVASFVGFSSQELTVLDKEEVRMTFSLTQQPSTSISKTISTNSNPYTLPAKQGSSDEVFMVTQVRPAYPGGMKALFQFLAKNLRYPAEAAKEKVQGKVFVNFVINTDGTIDRIRILKGIGRGCDEEAMRVVARMPNWIPGRQNGRPVAVQYNLPIDFSLGDKVGLNQQPNVDVRVSYSAKDSVVVHQGGSLTLYSPAKLPTRVNSTLNPPLFLLDGEEITQEAMDAIDPNTIQSVDVLKGESTKTTYGLKGKNGVVRITTKKGGEAGKKKD